MIDQHTHNEGQKTHASSIICIMESIFAHFFESQVFKQNVVSDPF